MRTFTNMFLLLFLADGGFSLVDELIPLLTPLEPFTAFRLFLAINVLIMATILYFCLGIDKRLPKRILLPQILLVFFVPLSTWFFPAMVNFKTYGLLAAAVQIAFGMLPLYFLNNNGVRTLTLPQEMFTTTFFSIRNSLIFSMANLVIIPIVLTMFALSIADSYLSGYTSGFMHVEPGGLKMSERIYQRGNKTIRLAAMIHIGDKDYYNDLAASIVPGRTIILTEGVTDTRKLLHNGLDYGKMAGVLGLTSQKEMNLQGRIIDAQQLDTSTSPSALDEAGKIDIIRADVDTSDFRPPTILLLNAVGKNMQEQRSFTKNFMALNSWGDKNLTPEMYATIMDDILHRRNMAVIGFLDKAMPRYDTIVIPWGALHMPELEAEVLKRGFRRQEERERISIDFWKMFLRKV